MPARQPRGKRVPKDGQAGDATPQPKLGPSLESPRLLGLRLLAGIGEWDVVGSVVDCLEPFLPFILIALHPAGGG